MSMSARLFLGWIFVLVNMMITVTAQAQSQPQQPTLQWADLGSTGVPTGTYIPINNLSTAGDNFARYIVQVGINAFSQLSVGNSLTGTFPDTDTNHLPPNHPIVHWPGNSSGSLAGDYRLESNFQGSITHISATGNPFPIDTNFQVVPDPSSSFDAAITGGHISLFNAQTNELIADLPITGGHASGIHFVGNGPPPFGSITLDAVLGPGCAHCDAYILMPDGSSINGRTIPVTFTGDAPVLSTAYNPTGGQLQLYMQNNGTSSSFVVPATPGPTPVLPPPPISLVAIINADNIMEGNNGNPMRTLLASGQSSAGAIGSIGRNDHQGLNGGLGNGQLRFAHNFGFAQFNLSAGGLWGNNDTFRGDTILRGAYVIPEVISKIPQTTIHVTATGIYSPGEVNPDVSTLGGRIRADWLDAFKILNTVFTPYASYTYIHTSIARFTDKSQSFFWDQQSDQVNTARYGMDAVIGVTSRVNLLARIEGSHRFESHSNNVTGHNLSNQGVSFAGVAYKQDWIRGGVGVEGRLGNNFIGLMLNATSQGPVTSYWLTTSYRAAF
jgi:hypothetical protein